MVLCFEEEHKLRPLSRLPGDSNHLPSYDVGRREMDDIRSGATQSTSESHLCAKKSLLVGTKYADDNAN